MKLSKNMKFYVIGGLLFATAATANVTIGRWIFGSNYATLPTNYTMKADFISNTAGGPPPGMVPIGGMVAVMPSTHANAWQPPASGAIKDGFMRADGATIDATDVSNGCVFAIGTVLPNMVGSYPKGTSTTSGAATAYAISVPAHRHNTFSLATSIGLSGTAASLSGSAPSLINNSVATTAHNHETDGIGSDGNTWYKKNAQTGEKVTLGGYVTNITWTASGGAVRHGFYTTNNTSATVVGIVGGSYSLSGGSYSLTGSNTVTGTIGNQAGSNGDAAFATSGDPANVTVIWVIRVR